VKKRGRFHINKRLKTLDKIYSIIPIEILEKRALGKITPNTQLFVKGEDIKQLVKTGNVSVMILIGFGAILYSTTSLNFFFIILISFITSLLFLYIFSDFIRTKINERHQEFDETAFLILNSLAINMVITKSFPHSVNLLASTNCHSEFYRNFFTDILMDLNLGKKEGEIITRSSEVFLSKKNQQYFESILMEEFIVDSDPDFLIRIKKMISITEDNIAIFIAVSCILPLILTLIFSITVSMNSMYLLLFPVFYAVYGSYLLKFIQNKSSE